MDVLIKGLPLPQEGEYDYHLTIRSDGKVEVTQQVGERIHTIHTWAIELPPHGDLIDRRELLKHRFEVYDSNEEVCEDYVETYHILEAPVVLEAST